MLRPLAPEHPDDETLEGLLIGFAVPSERERQAARARAYEDLAARYPDDDEAQIFSALYIAGMPPGSDSKRLFNQLLVWGLSMSVVGALICWLLFGLGLV